MDPFTLLGAPLRFKLDLDALEKTHRELSRALHPDKFAGAGASERRLTLEKAANVNEAWRIVRDPIRRAEALFRIAGVAVGETNEPKASPAFLMSVMEDREALAEARAARELAKVRELGTSIEARERVALAKLGEGFEDDAILTSSDQAALLRLLPLLGELRFYRRFLEEVSAIEDEALENAQAAREELRA